MNNKEEQTKLITNVSKQNNTSENTISDVKNKCGIIMPISSIDGCSAEHWVEVLSIIKDAVSNSGFEPNLVSDADDSGIIQKRIIHNLYSNEIVICDVSAKNPNVMFELGIRLAFDKPTLIIKDDITEYNFDTSIIEHLAYPRDLRFNKILTFKEALKKKITATYEKSITDPNYTTFLKHFGEYKVAHLTDKEVSSEKYIVSAIDELRHEMFLLRRSQKEIDNTKLNSEISRISLITSYIEEFKKENNLDSNFDIILLNKEEDLLKKLERKKEIRNYFDTRLDLKNTVSSILTF